MKIDKNYLKRFVPSFLMFSLFFCFNNAFGDIIHVPGDQPTIQAGINAAVNGDIVLIADGIYTGDQNKNLNFFGRAITVESENGPENCIIDLQGDGWGFSFWSGEDQDSVVSGFTIKNFTAGGINCDNSSPTIRNCIITNGSAGGINCRNNSSPTIRNCIITNNADSGIMCYINSSPSIENCTIKGNTGDYGGGIHIYNASPKIVNCVLSGNTTYLTGTIHCAESSFPIIINSTITDNKGGGIHSYSSSPTITNSIFWGDSTDEIVVWPLDLDMKYSDVQGGYSGEGNIDTDPLFVDPDNGDFHLSKNSPCKDAGTDAGVYVDIDGDSRPQGSGFDIGADEILVSNFSDFILNHALIKFKELSDIDSYYINGSFTLGENSDGIDPLEEVVKLKVGTSNLEIPAGSFVKMGKRKYKFIGGVGDVSVHMSQKRLKSNGFRFTAWIKGIDLTDTPNPVPIGLHIGNDMGQTDIWLSGILILK